MDFTKDVGGGGGGRERMKHVKSKCVVFSPFSIKRYFNHAHISETARQDDDVYKNA